MRGSSRRKGKGKGSGFRMVKKASQVDEGSMAVESRGRWVLGAGC